MRPVEPEPWALGVRLRDEPNGVHRLTVAPALPPTAADRDLTALPESAWISFVVRRGKLVPVSSRDGARSAGDEALVLGEPRHAELFHELSSRAATGRSGADFCQIG